MNIRVKIEYADRAKGNYGYATTEHSASSYGLPVIAIGDEPHGAADIAALGGTIVTANKELAAHLSRIGYPVRVSEPQKKWDKENLVQVKVNLTVAEKNALDAYSAEHGVTPYGAIKDWIKGLME